MNLHVMSDLHTELMSDQQVSNFLDKLRGRQREVDTLVLAGDIGNLAPRNEGRLLKFLLEVQKLYKNVYYVPGNHEFWGTSIKGGQQVLKQWATSCLGDVGVMPALDWYEHDESSIGGSTLWYPDCGDELAKKTWCDYAYISDGDPAIHEHHADFRLVETLPEIVVTHHYPTSESIAPHWAWSPVNVFFCAYMDEWLPSRVSKTKLWIHGHTHEPFDYVSKFGFRVYCNPYGYKNERANPDFWERLNVVVP